MLPPYAGESLPAEGNYDPRWDGGNRLAIERGGAAAGSIPPPLSIRCSMYQLPGAAAIWPQWNMRYQQALANTCRGVRSVALNLNEAAGLEPAHFQLLINSIVDYAIYMIDVDGRVRSWNAGAARLKGYTAEEIIGRSFGTFYSRRGPSRRDTAKGATNSARDRPLCSRGLARSEGRHPVLGLGGDRRNPRCQWRASRLRENHPRHHGSAGGAAGADRKRAALSPPRSRPWSTMRSSSWTHPVSWPLGIRAPNASRATRQRRLSGSISAGSTPRRTAKPAFPRWLCGPPPRRANMKRKAGAFARTARRFWASGRHRCHPGRRRRPDRLRQGDARHHRTP